MYLEPKHFWEEASGLKSSHSGRGWGRKSSFGVDGDGEQGRAGSWEEASGLKSSDSGRRQGRKRSFGVDGEQGRAGSKCQASL